MNWRVPSGRFCWMRELALDDAGGRQIDIKIRHARPWSFTVLGEAP